MAVARSCLWELLGWHHRVFRVRATTTAVHDPARASAFQSGLARRAIVGPVRAACNTRAHTKVGLAPVNSNVFREVRVDKRKLHGAPVYVRFYSSSYYSYSGAIAIEGPYGV